MRSVGDAGLGGEFSGGQRAAIAEGGKHVGAGRIAHQRCDARDIRTFPEEIGPEEIGL